MFRRVASVGAVAAVRTAVPRCVPVTAAAPSAWNVSVSAGVCEGLRGVPRCGVCQRAGVCCPHARCCCATVCDALAPHVTVADVVCLTICVAAAARALHALDSRCAQRPAVLGTFQYYNAAAAGRSRDMTTSLLLAAKQHRVDDNNTADQHFDFNEENYERVRTILAKYPGNYKQSGILPLLDLAQRQVRGWPSLCCGCVWLRAGVGVRALVPVAACVCAQLDECVWLWLWLHALVCHCAHHARASVQVGNFLPLAAMNKVAEICEVPPMRVYEVAAFYTMFNREKVGKYFIQLCGTTPCMVCGSEQVKQTIMDYLHIGDGGACLQSGVWVAGSMLGLTVVLLQRRRPMASSHCWRWSAWVPV